MKNILISDANHGGLTLLEEYSKYTKNNLFFYDTYNKLNLDMKEFYKKKYNRFTIHFFNKILYKVSGVDHNSF